MPLPLFFPPELSKLSILATPPTPAPEPSGVDSQTKTIMSDQGTLLLEEILGLYPAATTAVDRYKEAKPDLESHDIARKIAGQATLYTQLTRLLMLLSDSTSLHDDGFHRRLVERLGPVKTAFLVDRLAEMKELLHTIQRSLGNARRGTVWKLNLLMRPRCFANHCNRRCWINLGLVLVTAPPLPRGP